MPEYVRGSDLVIYEGNTTSNGSEIILIDSNLINKNDFITGTTVYITSGIANKEVRDILSFDNITGTITVGSAFSGKIVSGVSYKILAIRPADVEVGEIQADIGNASTSTLGSLYGIVGNPTQDLATSIDTIKTDTQVIEDATLKTAPTAGSLARFIASGGTALGTQLPDSKSLYDCLSGGVTVVDRVVGKRQVFTKAITIAANAGATTIGTITTQPCVIESIIVHANTAQTANLTSCAVTGGASNVVTFINTATATQGNLDAIDKQVAWTGAVRLAATKTIVMTLVGTGAAATDMTVTIEYEACVAGGYLV